MMGLAMFFMVAAALVGMGGIAFLAFYFMYKNQGYDDSVQITKFLELKLGKLGSIYFPQGDTEYGTRTVTSIVPFHSKDGKHHIVKLDEETDAYFMPNSNFFALDLKRDVFGTAVKILITALVLLILGIIFLFI